jgi:hypothetical protein
MMLAYCSVAKKETESELVWVRKSEEMLEHEWVMEWVQLSAAWLGEGLVCEWVAAMAHESAGVSDKEWGDVKEPATCFQTLVQRLVVEMEQELESRLAHDLGGDLAFWWGLL